MPVCSKNLECSILPMPETVNQHLTLDFGRLANGLIYLLDCGDESAPLPPPFCEMPRQAYNNHISRTLLMPGLAAAGPGVWVISF